MPGLVPAKEASSVSELIDLERLQIEHACARLSVGYANHIDARRYDAFVELFADDAELDTGGLLRGKEAIRRAMARRSDRLRSRHVLTNILIDVIDADHARGVTYLTLYRHIGDVPDSEPIERTLPAGIGQYKDEFVRGANGFRIARRVLTFAFRDPSAFPNT